MILPAPSIFSHIAVLLYLVVTASCLLALVPAVSQRQVRWHLVGWSLLAVLFVVLAIMRHLAAEDLLREELRTLLRQEGAYDDRREVQGPIFAAIFIGAAAIGGFWFYHITQTIAGRRNIAAVIAIAAGGVMLFLVLLRIVSLHSVDELLYGPLKLNWLIDIGCSLIVLGCGIHYWRVVTGRASQRL